MALSVRLLFVFRYQYQHSSNILLSITNKASASRRPTFFLTRSEGLGGCGETFLQLHSRLDFLRVILLLISGKGSNRAGTELNIKVDLCGIPFEVINSLKWGKL